MQGFEYGLSDAVKFGAIHWFDVDQTAGICFGFRRITTTAFKRPFGFHT